MTTYNAQSASKLVAWVVPNAAALAAILPTHGQEGLVARAVDTGFYYELLAIDPTGTPTWSAAIGGGGGGGGGPTTGELLTFLSTASSNATLSNNNLTAMLTATGVGVFGTQPLMQDESKAEFTLIGALGLLAFGFAGAVTSAGGVGNNSTVIWNGATWSQSINDGTTSAATAGTCTGLVAPAAGDIFSLQIDPATRTLSLKQKQGATTYTAVLQYPIIPGNSAVQPFAEISGTAAVTGMSLNAGQAAWAIASGAQFGPMAQESYPNSSAIVHAVTANITVLNTAPYTVFMVDTTTGNKTINFPAAPVDKQRIGVCNYKYNDGVAATRYGVDCHFGNTYKAHGFSDIWVGPEVLRMFQFDATSSSWVENSTANNGPQLLHISGAITLVSTDQELTLVVDASAGNVAAPTFFGNINGQRLTIVKADYSANTVGLPWANGGPLYAAGETSTGIYDSMYGSWVELTDTRTAQNLSGPALVASTPGANLYQYTNPLGSNTVHKACTQKVFIEDPANTLVQWTRDGATMFTEGFTTSGSTILAPGDSVIVTNAANAPTVTAFPI